MGRSFRHLVAALGSAAAALVLTTGLGAATGTACPSPPADAPVKEQKAAMLCLVGELREEGGLRALRRSVRLDRAARLKADAIVRCEDFSHTPCGRSFASTFVDAGYAAGGWAAGENLAWGAGARGSVASVFQLWLDSPVHRTNLLRRVWRDVGLAVWHGPLFGHERVAVWVIDFGRRP
jgi:uncharacterized protein YkwD